MGKVTGEILMGKFYITTAIDYVNSLPHIGTAYEKITADCIARAKRILGYDVRFSMGTDEHSINVKKKAVEAGLSPREFCDRMAAQFEEFWGKLSISYDNFIRTTEDRHIIGVTELFKRIDAAGDIYTSDYRGWYCEGCEAFIQEKDLVDGNCPNHRTRPAWIEETNYFFRLSRYGQPLLDIIRKNPDFIRPVSRRNEIVKLIEGGLDDISVSRSGFDWGIPLPGDPTHVVYVWFDALINYISGLGFGGEDESLFDRYWPADLHIIGKDITRFHCVIWPAMLMSAGLPVPQSIFGHGFIYHRGEKMSKSLGNVVSPLDIADTYGADPLRFFLLREVVHGLDGDFTFERFIERYNSDLANDLGNLVSRTIAMIHRYRDGILPLDAIAGGYLFPRRFSDVADKWKETIERYELSIACDIVMDYVREANRFIEDRAPWKLAKDPAHKDELDKVLCDLASVIVGTAILLSPYIPDTSRKIREAFGCSATPGEFPLGTGDDMVFIPSGTEIQQINVLFPRIEEKKQMSEKEKEPSSESSTPSEEEYVSIEDFVKLDIRVGTVMTAEKVENSSKLLRLKIDDGRGGRTILAGIAKNYSPDELVGRQVSFIANLQPRKMMGEYSHGMVLAAVDGDNVMVLHPSGTVTPGTKVS
ncbi:methionine--tRNA ligase [bacterium]|nr:methionine--tRNA ligase [bacterium]